MNKLRHCQSMYRCCWRCRSEVRVSERDSRGASVGVSLRGLRTGGQSGDGQQPDGHCVRRFCPAPHPRTRKSDNDDKSADSAPIRACRVNFAIRCVRQIASNFHPYQLVTPRHRDRFYATAIYRDLQDPGWMCSSSLLVSSVIVNDNWLQLHWLGYSSDRFSLELLNYGNRLPLACPQYIRVMVRFLTNSVIRLLSRVTITRLCRARF